MEDKPEDYKICDFSPCTNYERQAGLRNQTFCEFHNGRMREIYGKYHSIQQGLGHYKSLYLSTKNINTLTHVVSRLELEYRLRARYMKGIKFPDKPHRDRLLLLKADIKRWVELRDRPGCPGCQIPVSHEVLAHRAELGIGFHCRAQTSPMCSTEHYFDSSDLVEHNRRYQDGVNCPHCEEYIRGSLYLENHLFDCTDCKFYFYFNFIFPNLKVRCCGML